MRQQREFEHMNNPNYLKGSARPKVILTSFLCYILSEFSLKLKCKLSETYRNISHIFHYSYHYS